MAILRTSLALLFTLAALACSVTASDDGVGDSESSSGDGSSDANGAGEGGASDGESAGAGESESSDSASSGSGSESGSETGSEGEDGAGGSGEVAGITDRDPSNLCPPEGPYGKELGDTMGSHTLYDCDGEPVNLHDFCSAPATIFYHYKTTCAACVSFASGPKLLNAVEKFGEDVEIVFVDTDIRNPDQCKEVAETYNLDGTRVRVLYDKMVRDENDKLTYFSSVAGPARAGAVAVKEGMEFIHARYVDGEDINPKFDGAVAAVEELLSE